jgi:hypothetical protein
MMSRCFSRVISGIVFFLLCAELHAAQDYGYRCMNGTRERVIAVEYPENTPLPCQVTYTKQESFQVLWSAENSQGYCEARAEDFVEQQRDWGWQCEQVSIQIEDTGGAAP